jgi:hypothetical protein
MSRLDRTGAATCNDLEVPIAPSDLVHCVAVKGIGSVYLLCDLCASASRYGVSGVGSSPGA